MDATSPTLQDMTAAVDRVRADLPIDEMVWLLPPDFLPDVTALMSIKVRRVVGVDRPYLAHHAGELHQPAPLGDPTSATTAYAVVATEMERWVEKHYSPDFFPDGQRGSRDVVQALLDLGWRPPSELPDEDVNVHLLETGGPGNGIVVSCSDGEAVFPLPQRQQKVTVAQLRRGLADALASA